MTTAQVYSIQIVLRTNGSLQFSGSFTVENDLVTSFFNDTNPTYDILASDSGHGADYGFINDTFTNSGTNILDSVPFLQNLSSIPITEWELWHSSITGDGISFTTNNWNAPTQPPNTYDLISIYSFIFNTYVPPVIIPVPIGPLGSTTNSVVPTYSKPVAVHTDQDNGTAFRARPLKHYRKRLLPLQGSGSSNGRVGIGMPMDLPGGASYLGDVPENTVCLLNYQTTTSTAHGIKEQIFKDSSSNIKINQDDSFYDPIKQQTVCVACTPQTNIIRSAIVLTNKNYYIDTKAFLRSRCQLYEQNNSSIPVPGIQYINAETGLPFYPNNTPTGPQVRLTQNCARSNPNATPTYNNTIQANANANANSLRTIQANQQNTFLKSAPTRRY